MEILYKIKFHVQTMAASSGYLPYLEDTLNHILALISPQHPSSDVNIQDGVSSRFVLSQRK